MILHSSRPRTRRPAGLSLLEMLLAMTLLSIVMVVIAAAINTMQNTWLRLREKSDEFRGARLALDSMSRHLQQATLATRWVPAPEVEGTTAQRAFKRESNLHFVSGQASTLLENPRASGHAVFFQGPFGEPQNDPGAGGSNAQDAPHDQLTDLLCAWGYFVEFGTDNLERPDFLNQVSDRVPPRRRFRLMEFRQPAEQLSLFQLDATQDPPRPLLDSAAAPNMLYQWFREPLKSGNARKRHISVVAENVLACIITPFNPVLGPQNQFKLAENPPYDSRKFQYQIMPPPVTADAIALDTTHKLPPALRLTIIMMSEDSWRRLTDGELDSTASRLRTSVNTRFRKLEDPDQFERELNELEGELIKIKMRYRIFTTNVRMSEQ